MNLPARNNRTAALLLRAGLVVVFLYASFSQLAHPLEWTSYLPHFVQNTTFISTAVRGMALYELGLAVWLISGRFVRYAALLCALTFAGIICFSLSQLIVTFRDFGLLFAALSLYFMA